jgi:hypothetical protein
VQSATGAAALDHDAQPAHAHGAASAFATVGVVDCCESCTLKNQRCLVVLSHRSQTKQGFIRSLLLKLLDIAQAAAAGPYAWLASREAGQGSAANAIKVAVWQALCVLAPWVDNELAPEVGSSQWHGSMKSGVKCVCWPAERQTRRKNNAAALAI